MRFAHALLAFSLLASSAGAQQPQQGPAADYRRAEQYLAYNTAPLIFGMGVRPNWLANDRFWYRNTIPQGSEFVLVDPSTKSRTRLFDQTRLASALSQVA